MGACWVCVGMVPVNAPKKVAEETETSSTNHPFFKGIFLVPKKKVGSIAYNHPIGNIYTGKKKQEFFVAFVWGAM